MKSSATATTASPREVCTDHPFQWGSKRTGPDLARVGGKYSDQWQADHLINPRSLVPESIMPGYPWLAETKLEVRDAMQKLRTLQRVGQNYSSTSCHAGCAPHSG